MNARDIGDSSFRERVTEILKTRFNYSQEGIERQQVTTPDGMYAESLVRTQMLDEMHFMLRTLMWHNGEIPEKPK